MKYKTVFIVSLAALAVALTPVGVWAQTSVPVPTIEVTQSPSKPVQESVETKPATPFQEEGEEDRVEMADPREVKDVLRQLKDQRREAQRTIKKATKANLTTEVSQLNEILAQISSFEASFKGRTNTITRDAMQDFYDSQLWESVNNIRIRVEMPNEIKSIEKEMKKLEKMMNRRNFTVEGIDMEKVKTNVAEVRGAIEQAKNSLAQGSLEDAQEAMQVIYEGAHPGEIMGVLNGLFKISKEFKRIKSEDIKNDIKEILTPVYEAVNEGDFREARMSFQEIEGDLRSIMNSLRRRSSIDDKMREKMDRLEEKLQQKFEGEENGKKGEKGKEDMGLRNTQSRQAYYDYRNYTASLLDKFLDFIGW